MMARTKITLVVLRRIKIKLIMMREKSVQLQPDKTRQKGIIIFLEWL
jgi:hypothetical protein